MFSDHHRDRGFRYCLEYSSDWNLELRDIRPPPPEINSKLASSHILYDQIYVWKESVLVTQSCLTLYDPVDHSPPGSSLCPWNSPGKNTGMGCHSISQGDLPNPGTESTSPALAGKFFTTSHLGGSCDGDTG